MHGSLEARLDLDVRAPLLTALAHTRRGLEAVVGDLTVSIP